MSDAKGFIADLDKWEQETLVEGVTEFTKLVASEALVGLVELSPRDTNRFASNHVVSIGQPSDYSEYELYDNRAIQRGAAVVESMTMPEIVYIQNSIPYAQALENGHSGQAPDGVYAPTVQDVSVRYNL